VSGEHGECIYGETGKRERSCRWVKEGEERTPINEPFLQWRNKAGGMVIFLQCTMRATVMFTIQKLKKG
jgi:hypothetical protein